MTLDRAALKREAKLSMRANSPKVYLITLLLLAVFYLLTELSTRLMFPQLGTELQRALERGILSEELVLRLLSVQPSLSNRLITYAIELMTVMLSLGYLSFCLNVSRARAPGVRDLFDGFGIFFRLLWLSILYGVLVFLWSLLFVIPGIVAAYRYSMAFYLMFDEPDKSAWDCLQASRALTQGHKGELFALDLSFLGWLILCIIPFVNVYVMPYYNLTRIQFYEALRGGVPGQYAL